MKSILTTCLLLFALIAAAQKDFTTVDRNEVEKLVKDKEASTYYPKLLSRFLNDDSTLSEQEFRLLYYGFVFQPGYSGYPDLKQKEINAAIKKEDYGMAAKLCDSVLSVYPINLYANYHKGMALYSLDANDGNFIRFRNRYRKLLAAIVSSGDGLSCQTAFKTIFINDEYQVVYKHFEVEQVKGQALETPCDKLRIAPSKYFNGEAIYFDTSETLNYMQRMFGKK